MPLRFGILLFEMVSDAEALQQMAQLVRGGYALGISHLPTPNTKHDLNNKAVCHVGSCNVRTKCFSLVIIQVFPDRGAIELKLM